jgi:putative acetyltransferase
MPSTLEIRVDDLSSPATLALIGLHHADMSALSPAESMHALAVDGLRHPDITFFAARIDGDVAGIGALKRLDARRGELKSMRVDDRFRGAGVGRALLAHIVEAARAEGLTSLCLETGTTDEFAPAHRLYASAGFVVCGPFDGYVEDPLSTFMTREI